MNLFRYPISSTCWEASGGSNTAMRYGKSPGQQGKTVLVLGSLHTSLPIWVWQAQSKVQQNSDLKAPVTSSGARDTNKQQLRIERPNNRRHVMNFAGFFVLEIEKAKFSLRGIPQQTLGTFNLNCLRLGNFNQEWQSFSACANGSSKERTPISSHLRAFMPSPPHLYTFAFSRPSHPRPSHPRCSFHSFCPVFPAYSGYSA